MSPPSFIITGQTLWETQRMEEGCLTSIKLHGPNSILLNINSFLTDYWKVIDVVVVSDQCQFHWTTDQSSYHIHQLFSRISNIRIGERNSLFHLNLKVHYSPVRPNLKLRYPLRPPSDSLHRYSYFPFPMISSHLLSYSQNQLFIPKKCPHLLSFFLFQKKFLSFFPFLILKKKNWF